MIDIDVCTTTCGWIQRPTAKELLRNRFIQRAKKTTYLVELIEKYKRWKLEHSSDDGEHDDDDSDKDSDL